jgi:hypothetical protein
MRPPHLAPIDEEVSEALLYDRPEPVHAFAPDGTAATASAVEPIWQRVSLHSSANCLYPHTNHSVAAWEREKIRLHMALREWIRSGLKKLISVPNNCPNSVLVGRQELE